MLRAYGWRLPRLLMRSLKNSLKFQILQRPRYMCSYVSLSIERLSNRSIVRVSGNDAVDYLQGLITNDMRHLSEVSVSANDEKLLRAMYCMFLDARGRVVLDSIIYRVCHKDNGNLADVYYVECDKEISATLLKHLKLYKLRKRVDITHISDEMDVWVEFCPDATESVQKVSSFVDNSKDSRILAFRDPRLHSLGARLLCLKGDFNPESPNRQVMESGCYTAHRYRLGVGEGIHDIPPGNSFPLEANCDYLHGVSFHKGCYVGQELTARTYHTGVVRKRLMPLKFPCSLSQKAEASVVDVTTSKSVGKIRGVVEVGGQCVGLGLLRVAEVLKAPALKVGDSEVKTEKPIWWPEEAPKGLKSKGSA